MNRKDFIKKAGIGISVAMITPSILVMEGCNTGDVIANTRKVIKALNDVIPFFDQLPNATTFIVRIQDAISIADKLIVVINGKEISNAIQLANALINAFQLIATDTKVFPIPTQVAVLAILGIANVALHFIVDWADKQAKNNLNIVASIGATSTNVDSFRKEQIWGKLLH